MWEAYKCEMEFPLCLRGPNEGVIHDFQSTLFVAGTLRASVRTDGLLGSMLCHAEPLQEPLALIWTLSMSQPATHTQTWAGGDFHQCAYLLTAASRSRRPTLDLHTRLVLYASVGCWHTVHPPPGSAPSAGGLDTQGYKTCTSLNSNNGTRAIASLSS